MLTTEVFVVQIANKFLIAKPDDGEVIVFIIDGHMEIDLSVIGKRCRIAYEPNSKPWPEDHKVDKVFLGNCQNYLNHATRVTPL